MARRNPVHHCQRCLRPSALGDVCLHDARFGPSAILTALPRLQNSPLAKCGSKKFCMDFHGDHPSTCTAHSGATKAHDWMVSVLGPLFRTAGHVVRTQHGVTASAGQRRGDVEIRNYLRDQAGRRSLVFDLSIAHDRFGSSSHPQQNRSLTHPQDIDAPLRVAAQRSPPIGNSTLTIRTFLFSPRSLAHPPACPASFCVFFFYRRLRHTSLPLDCHRKPTTRKHSGSRARHSTNA